MPRVSVPSRTDVLFLSLVCSTREYRTRLPYSPFPPIWPMDSLFTECTAGGV